MYRLTELLRGTVEAELVGADTARFLNRCAQGGIELQRAEPLDECTLRLRLRRRALPAAETAAEKSGCTLRVLRERGLPRAARRLRGRVVLLAGALLVSLSLLWASLHVWEIELRGNERVGEPELLAALEEAGVGVGSFWPDFVNERIKCRVLHEIPALSWMAVQMRGSRAVAAVREAVPPPEIYDARAVTEIVAGKAGLVTELRVMQGTAAAKPGQTVLPGETLVSAEMRSSFERAGSRRVHAVAEVYARTWYSLSACAPLTAEEKRPVGRERLRAALLVGDRRINFYDNSRNLPANYDKLIRTYRFEIPGVFSAPLAIRLERCRAYETETAERDRLSLVSALEDALTARLRREIGETGQVRESAFSAEERNGMLYVTLRAECLENIARERRIT